MNEAQFIQTITVVDPDTNNDVELSLFKHEGGGMFAIDSSFVDQAFDDDEIVAVGDPLSFSSSGVRLLGL